MARPTSRARPRPTAPRWARTRSPRRARSWAGTIPPFEIPADILAAWREAGERGQGAHEAWRARLAASGAAGEFSRRMAGELPEGFSLDDYLDGLIANPQKVATRKASELALEAINALLPETIGGSADLTGSNNTKTKAQKPLTKEDYSGRYIYYGIREFGMAAAMNGMALHGGVIPYGGTFLVFSDYARPAIRLSALQQVRVIYVMTHDSIGLGEDGPTHQPVEHLMSLRAMPNLDVYRPADAVETAECWALALRRADGPSLLALTRQNLPQLRLEAAGKSVREGRLSAARRRRRRAGSCCSPPAPRSRSRSPPPRRSKGRGSAPTSSRCPAGSCSTPRTRPIAPTCCPATRCCVSIEAGATLGWERYTGRDGLAIGLDRFGASAPADDLFKRFGFTAEAIVPQIVAALKAQGDQ